MVMVQLMLVDRVDPLLLLVSYYSEFNIPQKVHNRAVNYTTLHTDWKLRKTVSKVAKASTKLPSLYLI